MKKIIVFFLCMFLLISSFTVPAFAATTTFNITDLKGKYISQGRTEIVDNALFLDWSASGIKFKANCSGDVSIKLNTTRISTSSSYGLYFTVIVDGVVQYENQRIPADNSSSNWKSNSTNYPFRISKSGTSTFTIAENLPSGVHTIEILKQTEASHGAFGIQSITLNGEILAAENKNELYVEFIGDSVTASYGSLTTGNLGTEGAPLYQDATRGWPYLTAKKLNADYSIIANSGITASDGIGWGKNPVSMQTVYPKLRYFSDTTKNYNFNPSPDIVVLALGTNDINTYKSCGKSLDYVKEEFKKMLDLVKQKQPNAKIIWIHGMMTSGADSLITSVIKEAGGADLGFYSLALPKNTSGGNGHPNLDTQETYATKLADFIKGITKSDNNSQNKPSGNTQNKPSGNTQNKPSGNTTSSSTSQSTGNNTQNNPSGNTTSSSTSQNTGNNTQNKPDSTKSSSTPSKENPGVQSRPANNQQNITSNSEINNVSGDNVSTYEESIESEGQQNTKSNKTLLIIILFSVFAILIAVAGIVFFLDFKHKKN